MTSHHPTTPISGDAEPDATSEAFRLNIPRAFWESVWARIRAQGCDHTTRHTEATCADYGMDWDTVSGVLFKRGLVCDCEAVLNWEPLPIQYPEYTTTPVPLTNSEYSPRAEARAEPNRRDSHTTILPPGTPDRAVAEPVTGSGYSPLDGRAQPISHRQRVAVGCAPEVGVEQGGGGTDSERFRVSLRQPILPLWAQWRVYRGIFDGGETV